MKIIIIAIALLLILGVSIAGITSGITQIGTEPVLKTKEIPDIEYQEIKSVLEKGGVTIDDKIGLDINWVEKNCANDLNTIYDENGLQTSSIIIGTTCEYELYKKNLFGGATINVSYNTNDSAIQIQEKLDQAIQNKVEFVKGVWEERQEKIEGLNQTGVTNFKTDKKVIGEIK
jgi:ribosomal protein S13